MEKKKSQLLVSSLTCNELRSHYSYPHKKKVEHTKHQTERFLRSITEFRSNCWPENWRDEQIVRITVNWEQKLPGVSR